MRSPIEASWPSISIAKGTVRCSMPAACAELSAPRFAAWRPGPLPLAMAGLLVMQLLGICGAVLAATIEIVSIVGSGPIFSILGLVVAECGRRSGSRALIWLGTSALVLALSLFGLINLAGWGPKEARDPVSLILLVYEGVIVPIGLIILWRAFVPRRSMSEAGSSI